ncbi:hypothetical protein SALBM311S_01034 [Streptomyces alboniger]
MSIVELATPEYARTSSMVPSKYSPRCAERPT